MRKSRFTEEQIRTAVEQAAVGAPIYDATALEHQDAIGRGFTSTPRYADDSEDDSHVNLDSPSVPYLA